jgi:hypothetical protein
MTIARGRAGLVAPSRPGQCGHQFLDLRGKLLTVHCWTPRLQFRNLLVQ